MRYFSNDTWVLVPSHPRRNVVGCKWVFKIKRKPDGSIDPSKACLVAKAFHQRAGIDYKDTFSPIIKPTTIRVVLSIVVAKGWPIKQLDIQYAFFHSNLEEEVFMDQPPGFVDPQRSTHLYLLKKSLSRLKQALQACLLRSPH